MMAAMTCATGTPPLFDMAMLRKVADLVHHARKEPIAEWMRSQGFDPDEGCTLVLPAAMFRLAGAFPPDYVLLSQLVDAPLLVRGMPRPPAFSRSPDYMDFFFGPL